MFYATIGNHRYEATSLAGIKKALSTELAKWPNVLQWVDVLILSKTEPYHDRSCAIDTNFLHITRFNNQWYRCQYTPDNEMARANYMIPFHEMPISEDPPYHTKDIAVLPYSRDLENKLFNLRETCRLVCRQDIQTIITSPDTNKAVDYWINFFASRDITKYQI